MRKQFPLLFISLGLFLRAGAPACAGKLDPTRLLDRLRWTYFRSVNTFEPERLRYPLVKNAAVELEVARAQAALQTDNVAAQLRLGRICDALDLQEERLAAYGRAAQLLEPAARAKPDDVELQARFLDALLSSGQGATAERPLTALALKHPERADVQLLNGDLHLARAAVTLAEADETLTDAERSRVERELESSAAAYRRTMELKPEESAAYYAWVTWERVRAAFRAATAAKPDEQGALIAAEARQGALATLLTLAEKRPRDTVAQWAAVFMAFAAIAEDVMRRNQLGKSLPEGVAAVAARLQSAETDPSLESYRREALGFVAMMSGDAEAAVRELDAAVRADQERLSPQIWLVAADLAITRGDYQKAAQRSQARLKERSCLHDWLVVAGAAKERNDYDTLERAAREALKLDEEEPTAYFALGLALLRKDAKSDDAYQALLQAAESVTDGELLLAIATASALRGEAPAAARFLRSLLERIPAAEADLRARVQATLADLEAAE